MPVYKNEKRKTWYAKFYYTDTFGNRQQKKAEGFKTKREAQEFERNFIEKSKTSPNITFKNLVENYLCDCEVRLKPTTYESKKYTIYSKLVPYFGEMKISDIDILTVRTWQNDIISHSNEYKPTYQKLLHNQLSAIMNYATKYYKLKENPARICGSIGKKNADTMQFWTVEEFNKFILSTEGDILNKTIFSLLFFSGLREGELLALTLNDFDFERNTVSVTKTLANINGCDIIQTPKTPKSKRNVSLPHKIMQMVLEYSKYQYDYSPTDRLFKTNKKKLLKAMDKYSKLAEVKRIRIHDLRHSYASMLINLNVSPLEIQERLGHENVETTLNTYSHLYPDKHSETTQLLEDLVI